MASTRLLFPQPLGPMITVMPRLNSSSVLSAKDLKPNISMRFRYIILLLAGQKTNLPLQQVGTIKARQFFSGPALPTLPLINILD